MFVCPGHKIWRKEARERLEKLFKSRENSQNLGLTLLDFLFEDVGVIPPPAKHPTLRHVHKALVTLGSGNLWKGRLPVAAVTLMHTCFTQVDSSQGIDGGFFESR